MSVYRRMLGRELPCTLRPLLGLDPCAIDAAEHEALLARVNAGDASVDDLVRLGHSRLSRGETGMARRLFADALRRRHGHGPARLGVALAYESLALHDKAAGVLDAIVNERCDVDLLPSRYLLLAAAGFEHERAGAFRSAIRRYNAAARIRPSECFVHHRLVAIYLSRGKTAQAALHLRAILKHHPAEKPARVCLAHLLQLAGRHAEAAWEYEQALCLEPDSWELPAHAAAKLQNMNGPAQALEVLEDLVRSQPHFPDLRMRLGNAYSQCGDDVAASEQYERALSMHPEYLDCHIAMARHELRMCRADVAAQHFRSAIAINEQNVEIYVGLALAMRHSERAAQAVDIVASAGRIARNSAVLMAQLALIERNVGEEEATICSMASELRVEWLEDLVETDRQVLNRHGLWNDVRLRLGMVLRMAGRPEQAWACFRDALEADPKCPAAWVQLGMCLSDCNKVEQALDAFGAALRLDRGQMETYYHLALAYSGDMEFELALEKVEESAEEPADVNRRIWTAIDSLQMTGHRPPVGRVFEAQKAA
jgi:tetratricopeptide (TPR) repeat protein